MRGHRLSEYRFRHVLFRQYLYRRLDSAELAYLNDALAAVLMELRGGASEV